MHLPVYWAKCEMCKYGIRYVPNEMAIVCIRTCRCRRGIICYRGFLLARNVCKIWNDGLLRNAPNQPWRKSNGRVGFISQFILLYNGTSQGYRTLIIYGIVIWLRDNAEWRYGAGYRVWFGVRAPRGNDDLEEPG